MRKLLGRSPGELHFRLRQEGWNLAAFLRPPRREPASAARLFPDPAAACEGVSSAYRSGLLALAKRIVEGRLPLLGTEVAFTADPPESWRSDAISGRSSDPVYFRRLPYLDAAQVGDHKVIWEVSRHQHLVLLAQAALLDPHEPRWLETVVRQLESWWRANPFHGGINWASALEVAFRALSWIWILHLVGDRLSQAVRRGLLASLYQHAAHLEHNLSIYFAPNTHLLGEAVCLHALGCLLQDVPEAARWRRLGAEWVARSMDHQVQADGVHFEQSSYYHLYSVDFFLLHAVLNPDAGYQERLRRMCEVLAALTDRDGCFPLLGDDDGGRLFHPYGERRRFPRATLTTASFFFDEPAWRFDAGDYAESGLWLFGPRPAADFQLPPRPRSCGVFRDSGLVCGGDDRHHIVFTARAFGEELTGHSHAHALHFVLRLDGRDLLLDSGTFTYISDRALRDRFRSNAAHNTVRVDGLDQAVPVHAFRWVDRWRGRLDEAGNEAKPNERKPIESIAGRFSAAATLGDPDGRFRLHRTLRWATGEALVCEDTIEGLAAESATGEHRIEQFWQLPPEARWDGSSRRVEWPGGAWMELPPQGEVAIEPAEVSNVLYQRSPAQTLRLSVNAVLPCRLAVTLRTPKEKGG